MRLDTDRRYRFPVVPARVWAAIAATGEYRRWWPWLTKFDAGGLVAGDVWRCTVRPPLRYAVRFTIHLDEVVPAERVAARLHGDIEGTARLALAPRGDGCEVRLESRLAPSSPAFGLIARLATPVVRRGHDWILDTGARQFLAHATDLDA